MCDTIVALQPTTAEHSVLFGKNSDRERNEAQAVEFAPRADHPQDAALACTYITIPQARRTHAVMLCRPFWMWGAEMGANEHGVVIGNEAVHARAIRRKIRRLRAWICLRLALERAASAAEAVEVDHRPCSNITARAAVRGHLAPRFYHNSFIVVDATEELSCWRPMASTAAIGWCSGCGMCARFPTPTALARDADRVSAGLKAHISDAGWSRGALPGRCPRLCSHHRRWTAATRSATAAPAARAPPRCCIVTPAN